jgi:hypothetical protein
MNQKQNQILNKLLNAIDSDDIQVVGLFVESNLSKE